MALHISGVSDPVSGVLQRRQRFDPQLPMNCGLPSKTSFYRGLQTVIATISFSEWPHAHGILSSELTSHAWYTTRRTNSPLTTLQKQKQAPKHMAVLQGGFFASLTAVPESSFSELQIALITVLPTDAARQWGRPRRRTKVPTIP